MPIDKTQLYPTFNNSLRRNQRLADAATRKALDLPLEDDVQIITDNSRQGLGRIGALLLSLAMLAGGGGAAVGALGLLRGFDRPAARQPSDAAPSQTAPQEFKVTFWSEDGQPLEVQNDE